MIQVWEMCGRRRELWVLEEFALLWGWAQE